MMPFATSAVRLAAPAVNRGVAAKWAPRSLGEGTVIKMTVPAARPPAAIPGSTSTYSAEDGGSCHRCSTPTPTTRPALMVGPADETVSTPPAGDVVTTGGDMRQWYIIGGLVLALLVLWLLSQRKRG